jgi:DNA-binding CsgD family transcriptional regulator
MMGKAPFLPAILVRTSTAFSPITTEIVAGESWCRLGYPERPILAWIAQGKTNADIVEKLVITPKTMRNHISNIFSKLEVADQAQATFRARSRLGWGFDQVVFR